MTAPTHRCPFKTDGAAGTAVGLTCEATACMAYDTTNLTCKILEAVQAYIKMGPANGFDPSAVSSEINN